MTCIQDNTIKILFILFINTKYLKSENLDLRPWYTEIVIWTFEEICFIKSLFY